MSDKIATIPSPLEREQQNKLPNQIPRLAKLLPGRPHFAKDGGGALYVYKDGVYRPHGEQAIEESIAGMLENGNITWTPQKGRDVAKFIALKAPRLWDRPPLGKVNVRNGILDIKAEKLLPHSPDFLSTTQLAVNYDPTAETTAWKRYAKAAFPKDAQMAPWEIVAWLMLPIMTIQKAILLVGGRGTGKSTFLRALRAFLGEENTSSSPLHYLEGNRFASTRLIGKLANICPDLPDAKLTSTHVFKAITGGDPITAEYKNGAIFDILPYCRLVFSANQLPETTDDTGAFTERWYIYHLSKKFENRAAQTAELDAELSSQKELSGVLNEALKVLPKVLESGLSVTADMQEILEIMRVSDSPARQWAQDHLEEGEPSDFLSYPELRAAVDPGINSVSLGLAIKELFPASVQAKKQVSKVRNYGIARIRWSDYHKNQLDS